MRRSLLQHKSIESTYPIFMGREEDEEDDGTDDQPKDDGDEEDEDEDDSADSSGKDPKVHELSRENSKRRNENKRLKKELEEAQARLREIDEADKSEVEKATEKATTLETENATLREALQEQRLTNAFLMNNDVTWHDPSMALSLLDTEDLLDDDGNIDKKALKAAIKSLKDEKPFLVKTEDDEEDPTPSGTPVGSRKGRKGDADRAALEKKYPALRR